MMSLLPGMADLTGPFFRRSLSGPRTRRLAYSELGHFSGGAAEFQKILDHPGIVLKDPIGPMARLQLVRALSASRNPTKSAAVYSDLLDLWKGAGQDIPVLRQAMAEYAKLR
jgi:eukaryotic-like serine/threonine-protein kinase